MKRAGHIASVTCALALGLGVAPVARAQEVALPDPIVPPAQAREGAPEAALDVDREIDLANVVTSAAKGVTTVQEAPSIVTIITSDEIRARGWREIGQALSTVPGWFEGAGVGQQVQLPIVRGVQQAVLLLHDGISGFDPWANIAALNRTMPLENIKRLEIVTGPGGVLWGANSFLGIVNVITKDADDVNGFEASAGYGDGPGNRQDARVWAMFGRSFLKGRLKVFQHASYESFLGSLYDIPSFIASSPAPQPPGPAFYGASLGIEPARSWLVTLDGKVSFGPVSLYYNVPFGDIHPQLVFANAIVPGDTFNTWDRWGILEYKDRFWKDRFGLNAKAYYMQFNRQYSIELFPPSGLFPPDATHRGGLHFDISRHLIQRTGVTLDTDLTLPKGVRLLFGGELFYESVTNSTTFFADSPLPAAQLPLYCPVDASGKPLPNCPRQFVNDASRGVGAVYLNAQWRPIQKLTFDGGVRLQKGFGARPYDLTPLYSGAIVWNFLPSYHVKASYTTGFRPPVFQNTESALGGLNYGGRPDLKTETSQSLQAEVNARLLRNVRKVRELELRVDYSYTFLDRFIVIKEGTYGNTGKRAIHSVEGYAKLYLAGDHFLQASYTYLRAIASDSGAQRNTPNHWLSLGGSFNVVKHLSRNARGFGDIALDLDVNLSVFGAYEDPNRYASRGGSSFDIHGGTTPATPGPTTIAQTTDLTFDRLSPVALLQLGFHVRLLRERIALSAQFYNVLNQRFYYPDFFNDLTPSVEMAPTPAPGFNFFASLGYHL